MRQSAAGGRKVAEKIAAVSVQASSVGELTRSVAEVTTTVAGVVDSLRSALDGIVAQVQAQRQSHGEAVPISNDDVDALFDDIVA